MGEVPRRMKRDTQTSKSGNGLAPALK